MQSPKGRRRRRLVFVVSAACMTGLVLFPRELPASIQEQRARLPPAAECPDPVEGYWKAHYFHERVSQWYVRTLEIHRKGDVLEGKIVAHYWDGGPKDEKPPPCRPGLQREQIVNMPSVGTFVDGKISFGGISWSAEPPICSRGSIGYNPDNFTGKIDPKLHEFVSVNNDGGIAVNEPNVFRRIRCLDAPPPPIGVKVNPPPFTPPRRGFRCGQ